MRTDAGAGEALPCEDSGEVTREDRLALFRLVLLHRLIEERVGLLYRQGRVSGSVYTGRGQEAVGAAAGYALGPDDVCAPLNRELACHLARGVTPAEEQRIASRFRMRGNNRMAGAGRVTYIILQ